MAQQEVQVQQKREVEKKQESTIPARVFQPVTDIFETDQALTVVFEMPGVSRENAEVGVENDVLTITGRIDFSKYEGLKPLYTEYNIGHYSRSFQVSSKIEQEGIKAEEVERRLDQDDLADAKAGRDDEHRQHVGEQVAEHQSPVIGADRASGEDEVALLHRQHLSSHKAGNATPADRGDDQREGDRVGPD